MAQLITDDELLNLPEDPVEAFVELQRIAEQRLNEQIEQLREDESPERITRKYVTLILGAAKEYGIEALNGWSLPDYSKSNMASYRPFIEALDQCLAEFRLKRARRAKQYSVALDQAAKEKLRHLLKQVRDAVDRLDIICRQEGSAV